MDDNELQVTLSYIDKVYAELNRTGIVLNRVLLITLIVSLLQLFAAAEWVSTEGAIALFGLGIDASYEALLLSSMLIVACLVVYSRALSIRGWNLYVEIRRLYSNINSRWYAKENDAMREPLTSPFRTLHFSRVIVAPRYSKLHPPQDSRDQVYESSISTGVLWLVQFFPTLAEAVTAWKLAQIIGWERPWLWLVFAFPVVTLWTVSITNYSYGFKDDTSSDPMRERTNKGHRE